MAQTIERAVWHERAADNSVTIHYVPTWRLPANRKFLQILGSLFVLGAVALLAGGWWLGAIFFAAVAWRMFSSAMVPAPRTIRIQPGQMIAAEKHEISLGEAAFSGLDIQAKGSAAYVEVSGTRVLLTPHMLPATANEVLRLVKLHSGYEWK